MGKLVFPIKKKGKMLTSVSGHFSRILNGRFFMKTYVFNVLKIEL